DRRLIEHNAAAFDVDKRIRGAQIDRQIRRSKTEQIAEHARYALAVIPLESNPLSGLIARTLNNPQKSAGLEAGTALVRAIRGEPGARERASHACAIRRPTAPVADGTWLAAMSRPMQGAGRMPEAA